MNGWFIVALVFAGTLIVQMGTLRKKDRMIKHLSEIIANLYERIEEIKNGDR